jgi:hypothetical protein
MRFVIGRGFPGLGVLLKPRPANRERERGDAVERMIGKGR